ncbi:MAG: beta-galactosidase, partial [Victivallaceae bacterium]|nr:beta-galactosidase [Victivallaceae bacterium]
AELKVDSDGNYLVNGSIRYLFGMQLNSDPAADLLPTEGYPNSLKWIYENALDYRSSQRLGFDTLALFNLPDFLLEYKPDAKIGLLRERNRKLIARAWESKLPVYVDFTCFPWTNGLLADKKFAGVLPGEAINAFRNGMGNHWVPYNINHPSGREVYKAIWRTGAQFARESGSPIVAYELFNEPAYDDPSDYNRGLFVAFLKKKYGTAAKMNACWRSSYPSIEAASKFRTKSENPGLFVDWSKFMEESFTELCRIGRETIEKIDPNGRFAVQPLARNSYRTPPSTNVNLYEISRVLNSVTTCTGGAAKVSGGWRKPAEQVLATGDAGRGEGFLQRHFFRAIADGKPIHNSEAYIGGDAKTIFNTVWRDLLLGSNATYLFEWSKRAWDFKPAGSAEGGRKVAERWPWMIVNPYALAPEHMSGFMKVKKEIFQFAEFFVPRERNLPREVAILISYPSERYGVGAGLTAKNDATVCASALEFTHFPTDVILEEQLPAKRASRYRAIVASGVRNTYPATVNLLQSYVREGGVLILVRDFMTEDEYGNAHGQWNDFAIPRVKEVPGAVGTFARLNQYQYALLPGEIPIRNVVSVQSCASWETLAFSGKEPLLLRCKLGKGWIYFISAAMSDYPMGAFLGGILTRHGIQPAAKLISPDTGNLMPGIELHAAKRGNRRCFFLFNHDRYAKLVQISVSDAAGYFDLVGKEALPLTKDGALVMLDGLSRAIVGVGAEKDFAGKFGPFARTDRKTLERRTQECNAKLEEQNARESAVADLFHPDLTRIRTLDLRDVCNRDFVDSRPGDGKGGWTDQGAEHSLIGVPWGVQDLLGVPCDLVRPDQNEQRSCIVLASKNQLGKLPERVGPVKVHEKVAAIYFFHTAAWAENGRKAAIYRIHYADGTHRDLDVVCGREVRDWWIRPNDPFVAWKNLASRGFFLWRWENPVPEKEIASLEMISMKNEVTFLVVGITLELWNPANKVIRHNFDWKKLRPFDTQCDLADSGVSTIRVTEKSKMWSGVILPFRHGDKLRGIPPKQLELVFYIRGGADRFGTRKGGQKYQFYFRHEEGKSIKRMTEIENLERFLVGGKEIDADRDLLVRIPLDQLKWRKQRVPSGITSLMIQARGTGNDSAVQMHSFVLEQYPARGL